MKHLIRFALGAAMLALLVPASASAETATKHHLVMDKQEQHVTLPEYETSYYELSCPHGQIAADGMWRIDEVGPFNSQLADPDELEKGGWNLGTGVSVLAAYPDEHNARKYLFTIRNNTSSNAQLKLWVTCLGEKTAPDTHQNALDYSDVKAKTYSWPTEGSFDTVPTDNPKCASGEFFISPGFKVAKGEAYLSASFPSHHLYEWNYGFYVTQPNTKVTVYGRCLENFTFTTVVGGKTHKHKLYAFLETTAKKFNKGNGVYEHVISCDDHQKGLVGGFDVRGGGFDWENFNWYWHTGAWNPTAAWYWLGMDPRIKARAFKTLGASGGGSYYLVCFNDRTSRPFYS